MKRRNECVEVCEVCQLTERVNEVKTVRLQTTATTLLNLFLQILSVNPSFVPSAAELNVLLMLSNMSYLFYYYKCFHLTVYSGFYYLKVLYK